MSKSPIPSAALDDRLGFVGTSGSGKTYAAGIGVERLLHKGARVVIVDPLGVWYGLRLDPTGKKPSPFPVVIFGGPHADLPLTEHAGKLIGETVAGMTESCIIALNDLQTKSAERRFMLSFLDALYRKADGLSPFHVIFDEADLWAPQKSSEPMLQSLMEQIVRRGRVKGFVPWLITQRPAVLSKDVLSQVDGLVAMKLTSSQDRDAIGNWVEGQADKQQWRDIWAQLPTMERGQGILWLPTRGLLDTVKFPEKETFDSSRAPRRGERALRAAELKPIDLGALKARLATVDQETKANDPKALRARVVEKDREISRLQAELTNKSTSKKSDPEAIKKAEERGYIRGFKQGLHQVDDVLAHFHTTAKTLVAAAASNMELQKRYRDKFERGKAKLGAEYFSAETELAAYQATRTLQPRPAAARPAPGPAQVPPRIKPAVPIGNSSIDRPLQLIINSIRWWNVMGIDTPRQAQVAFVAGYSHKSGTWGTYLSRLRSMALIEGRGDLVLTEQGSAIAHDPDTPPTDEQLRAAVLGKLDAPLVKILTPIIAAYPSGLSQQDAGEQAGYSSSSGTWGTYLSRLRSLDLIEGRGKLKAQDWLFPMKMAA